MAEETLNEALLEAMKEMEPIKRDSVGSTGKRQYKYAQLDQVLGMVKPQLFNHGLMLDQIPKFDGDKWVLETAVVHVASKERQVRDTRILVHSNNPKEQGSYETYMRRYALLDAFNLAPEDDDGQEAASSQVATRHKKPVDKIAEPTLKAIGDTCVLYAETFGINPQAFKQSVWEELQDKPEPEWLKKLSWMRSEIANSNERSVE